MTYGRVIPTHKYLYLMLLCKRCIQLIFPQKNKPLAQLYQSLQSV